MKNLYNYFLAITTIFFIACSEKGKLATVSTGKFTTYPDTKTVLCEGYVEADGGDVVVDRGICYINGSSTPTVADNRVSAGSGKGSFTAILEKIEKGTYSYCAFATNSAGTAYGSTFSFTMSANSTTGGGNNPEDNPQDGEQNKLTVSDFIGTYSCKAYSWDDNEYETWDGVKIYTFEGAYFSPAVAVQGLLWGEECFTAIGQFDVEKQCIRLFHAWGFTNNTFTFNGNDTVYQATFYPVSAIKGEHTFWYINNGGGYNGCGEAWLKFNNEGKLVLGPSDTPDNKGYYANGMEWPYYLADGSSTSPAGRFTIYIDIELTKTSSATAPKRMTSKNIINFHNGNIHYTH